MICNSKIINIVNIQVQNYFLNEIMLFFIRKSTNAISYIIMNYIFILLLLKLYTEDYSMYFVNSNKKIIK